jgi:hypothetical protein
VAGIKRPSQEPFSSLIISVLTEQELQGITCRIQRPVQVQPFPFDFDVGLIYSPGSLVCFRCGLQRFSSSGAYCWTQR